MGNVLDLKELRPDDGSPSTTGDVTAPPPGISPVGADDELEALISDLTSVSADQAQSVAWQAHHPLSADAWRRHYLLMAGFAVVGAAIAWWQGSFLTFLTVVIALAAWEVHERYRGPTRVSIDHAGMTVDGHRYPYAELASFDIHAMPDQTVELSIKTGRWHLPHLRLPVGDQDHEEVRTVLTQYLKESPHKIPYIDYFIRKP